MNNPSSSSLPEDEQRLVCKLIQELSDSSTRKNALSELSKRRQFPDLGRLLWFSFGTVATLLEEIINIFPKIVPPTLTIQTADCTVACNVLSLLACIAGHPETCLPFLSANIHYIIQPLMTKFEIKTSSMEFLRLSSLGVIAALVKNDQQDVMNYVLEADFVSVCLRNIKGAGNMSKAVAAYILRRIVMNYSGLCYVCNSSERFSSVAVVLENFIKNLPQIYSTPPVPANLLNSVLKIYIRLLDHARAREVFRNRLPYFLRDLTIFTTHYVKANQETIVTLMKLQEKLQNSPNLKR